MPSFCRVSRRRLYPPRPGLYRTRSLSHPAPLYLYGRTIHCRLLFPVRSSGGVFVRWKQKGLHMVCLQFKQCLTVCFCLSFRDRFVCPLPASVGMTSVGTPDGGIFDRFLSSRTSGGKGTQPVRGPGRAVRRGTGEGGMKGHRNNCGICSIVS